MSNLDFKDQPGTGGGEGSGVTPAELQAAIATRVAKAGDTMTGTLTATKFVGTGKIERAVGTGRRATSAYSLIDSWQSNATPITGALIIRLPKLSQIIMSAFKLAIGNHGGDKSSGSIEVGGYWGVSSVISGATARSFNCNLVNRIRLAMDAEGRHNIIVNP